MVTHMGRVRSSRGVGNVEMAVIVVALIAMAAVPLVRFVIPELDRWQRQVNMINALNSFQTILVGFIDDNGGGEKFIQETADSESSGLEGALFALSYKLMSVAQLNLREEEDDPAFCTVSLMLPYGAVGEEDVYVGLSRYSCQTGTSCPDIHENQFGTLSGVSRHILAEFYNTSPIIKMRKGAHATALAAADLVPMRLGIASFYMRDPSIYKIYEVGSFPQNPETGASGSSASSNCLPPFMCAPPNLNDYNLNPFKGCPG